jgi:hypothetical protein
LPVACCLLPVACCLLPVACCLLPVACCLLPVACCRSVAKNAVGIFCVEFCGIKLKLAKFRLIGIILPYIYCHNKGKKGLFLGKIGGNADAYCVGGLASRKPEKNKGSKKATLKTFILLLFLFLLKHKKNKFPVPWMARRDE